MKSVLVLAVPEDHVRARNIIGALNESNVDVFWDRTTPGTTGWAETIAKSKAASAVLLFLSENALHESNSDYVLLAEHLVATDKAVCVRLDDVDPPFDGCTSYDLRGWRGRASSLFMLDLVAGVRAKAAGLDPPLPRAPRHLLIRRLYIAVPSAIAALALIIGLYRDIGVDRIASPAEATAWSALQPGSCNDLRNFLSAYQDGVHADEAQALLASRRVTVLSERAIAERPVPFYVPLADAPSSASRSLATDSVARRAKAEARRLCEGLAAAASAKLSEVRMKETSRTCEDLPAGSVCALGGDALCQLVETNKRTVETCG